MGSIPNDDTYFAAKKPLFQVAIISGGISGCCTAIDLLNHAHMDVQIYEAASSFGEIGAGVALGPNIQRALKFLGPGILAAFEKFATPNLWHSHLNHWFDYIVVY